MKSKIVAVALLFALVLIPVFSWLFSLQAMPDQYGHWGTLTQIASMSTACRWLSMSADGNKIVFVSEEDGDAEIFIINSDGTKLIQLTNNTSNDIYPSISGDGKKIAFISHSHDKYHLFVVNSDGTGLKQLSKDKNCYPPSISGDGDKIAFATFLNSFSHEKSEFFVVNSDGTELKQLSNTLSIFTIPSISGDGSKIAFTSGSYGVWVVDSEGTGVKELFPNLRILYGAPISADGSKVTFLATVDDDTEVFVANTDGTELTSPTSNLPISICNSGPSSIDNLIDFSYPYISGDSSKIAFVCGHVFVIDCNGAGLTQVTSKVGDYVQPLISSDGSRIAFLSVVGEYKYDLFASAEMEVLETQELIQFIATVVGISAVLAAILGIGLLVYFKHITKKLSIHVLG